MPVTLRLELETVQRGRERIVWCELGRGRWQHTCPVDPNTGYWQWLGVGFNGLPPLES